MQSWEHHQLPMKPGCWPRWPCLAEDWGSRALKGSGEPPFRKLGGRVELGAPETLPHCGDHDSALGGGNCPLFPGGAGVQRVGGRGRPGSALLDRVVRLSSSSRGRGEPNQPRQGVQQKANKQLEIKFQSDAHVWWSLPPRLAGAGNSETALHQSVG